MPRFKTKPVEIEAILFTGDNVEEIWLAFGVVGIYGPTETNPDHLILTTADGNKIPCSSGMWVMKDSKPDTFYPCNNDHFQMKYEAVDEEFNG